MTKLLLVRHGQSEANKLDLFAGFYDADLMELGLEQAASTAHYLFEHYKVDKVFSSDLKRAYKTAEVIAKQFAVELTADAQLREISGGEWEGLHFPSLKNWYPEAFGLWSTDIGNAFCPGGETVRQFADRIMSALERIAAEHDGKTVVIVTHATPIRVVHTMLTHKDISCMQQMPWVSNASVTEIVRDETGWSMVKIGADEHLEGIRTALSGI